MPKRRKKHITHTDTQAPIGFEDVPPDAKAAARMVCDDVKELIRRGETLQDSDIQAAGRVAVADAIPALIEIMETAASNMDRIRSIQTMAQLYQIGASIATKGNDGNQQAVVVNVVQPAPPPGGVDSIFEQRGEVIDAEQ